MINLLSEDRKQEIKAAHANMVLINCFIFSLLASAFLALACLSTYYVVNSSVDASKNKQNTSTQQSTISSETMTEAVKSVLNQQVSYSTIMSAVAAALPSGAYIESIAFDNSSLNAPISFGIIVSASANIYEVQEGQKFKENPLFSDYTVNSTVTNRDGTKAVSVSVQINKVMAR